MKKALIILVSIFVTTLSAIAKEDKIIELSQLPAPAKEFVTKYFSTQTVAIVKIDDEMFDKSYDVIFASGDKVEFDKNGTWTEISCRSTGVPTDVIPANIKNYIQKIYSTGITVVQIEKTDRKGHELELSNGVELEFDKNGKILDIDVD